jgi:SNF family Na+-dependent transporter
MAESDKQTKMDGITSFVIALALAALYYSLFRDIVFDFKDSWIYMVIYAFSFIIAIITVVILLRQEKKLPDVNSNIDKRLENIEKMVKKWDFDD